MVRKSAYILANFKIVEKCPTIQLKACLLSILVSAFQMAIFCEFCAVTYSISRSVYCMFAFEFVILKKLKLMFHTWMQVHLLIYISTYI